MTGSLLNAKMRKGRDDDMRRILIHISISLATLSIITFFNPTSIVSFFIYLAIAILLGRLLIPNEKSFNIALSYSYFAFIAIIIYTLNYYILPGSEGFNRLLGARVGGDDYYFFNAAMDYTSFKWIQTHNYLTLLQIPKILSFTGNTHLIDMLLFNVIPASLIPLIVYKLYLSIEKDEKQAKLAKTLIMFSPIFLRTTGILLRDGWIMFSYLLVYYSFSNKKYYNTFIGILITGWLRVTDLVTLFITTYILNKKYKFTKNNLYVVLLIIISVFVFRDFFVYNLGRTSLSSENLFFRSSFVDTLADRYDGQGFFLLIYSLPLPIAIPLATLFFILMPIADISIFFIYHRVVPLDVFSFIGSILQFFYLYFFLKGTVYALQNRDRFIYIQVMYIVHVLIISFASMQIRHALILHPIFLMTVSYGYYHKSKYDQLIKFGIGLYVVLIIVNNLSKLF